MKIVNMVIPKMHEDTYVIPVLIDSCTVKPEGVSAFLPIWENYHIPQTTRVKNKKQTFAHL